MAGKKRDSLQNSQALSHQMRFATKVDSLMRHFSLAGAYKGDICCYQIESSKNTQKNRSKWGVHFLFGLILWHMHLCKCLEEFTKIAYDMPKSCFKLISISSQG